MIKICYPNWKNFLLPSVLRVLPCEWLHKLNFTGCFFFLGERHWSAKEIVGVDETVDEGESCEEADLEVPVEVEGGVVGHERGAKVHVPHHLLLFEIRKLQLSDRTFSQMVEINNLNHFSRGVTCWHFSMKERVFNKIQKGSYLCDLFSDLLTAYSG